MRLLATRSSIAPRCSRTCSPLSDLDANTIAAAKGYLDEGVTWTIADDRRRQGVPGREGYLDDRLDDRHLLTRGTGGLRTGLMAG